MKHVFEMAIALLDHAVLHAYLGFCSRFSLALLATPFGCTFLRGHYCQRLFCEVAGFSCRPYEQIRNCPAVCAPSKDQTKPR